MSNAASSPATLVANRGAITACVILAVIMQALDTTIANVALPYIQGSVSASADQINWVLTSYIVAAAVMTPPSGYLANRFGRKRILLTSITGFVVASVLCGFAQSLPQIVGFRLLQGLFGAALVPLSQSILLDIYSVEERGSAMALFVLHQRADRRPGFRRRVPVRPGNQAGHQGKAGLAGFRHAQHHHRGTAD